MEYPTRISQIEGFNALERLIDSSETVVICAHTSPDGDALGSQLALASIIVSRWPEKRITCLLADDNETPRIYRFLEGADKLVRAVDYEGTPDLFLCVDLSAPSRLATAQPILDRAAHIGVIDHHPAQEVFWEAGVVRPDAAAAGVIVCEFARHLGVVLTEGAAQCLFCAVATDTGRFQYQNANSEAFEIASELVAAGADPSEVSLRVYQSERINYLHLEARVMGRIRTFEDGRIAYSYATLADLEATGVDTSECDGLIDIVRRVDGAEVALFLRQAGNVVRGNLRAKGNLDVSTVARAMGGGGHQAASGFTSELDLDETLSRVLPGLRALVRGESVSEDGAQA